MKKQLATIFRSWADFLYSEPKHNPVEVDRPININMCEYKPQKIAIGREIDRNRVEEKLAKLSIIGRDDKREDIVSWYIEDARRWIEECIIKTIKDKGLIEYDIDRENMIVRGELKIWTK